MLLKIRDYVQQNGRVSLSDLARHFRVDPTAMRAMAGHWVAKGVLRHELAGPACFKNVGCSCAGGCDALAFELYIWSQPAPDDATAPDAAAAH